MHYVDRAKRVAAVIGLILPGIVPAADAAETLRVDLQSGASVVGKEIQRRADRVVIDLGFSVLTIPTDAIERVTRQGEEPTAEAASGTLYRLDPQRREQSVTENVSRCAEAVVQIKTPVGLGSGFIIHPDGYVVTNHHVIDGEHELTVTLFERTDQELRRVLFEKVRIVALDAHMDLALLKIEDPGGRVLPVVPIGDSSALVQGQPVFSIGSPLGFDRTISQGIVSLKNRLVEGQLLIQSTAQINPGNSGGPLFNLRGQVVGVNNMKIGAVGIEGLSFSIPARRLMVFLDNTDAFAFDTSNPNAGFRYYQPPSPTDQDIH